MPAMSQRILIADDYDDNRELLRLMLEVAGYEVREARNGRECVEIALDYGPDLCLIDLSMPVLDGWSTLEQLRNDSRTSTIPCLAVSASTDSNRGRIVGVGDFDAYLSKPFTRQDLLEVVERLLAARGLDSG